MKRCSALFVALLAVFVLAGCSQSKVPQLHKLTLADMLPTQAQPKLPTMKIYLGAEVLDTELALTPQEEMTGMMFRTNIPETDSMLFVLTAPQQASFWMKNCPEPLSAAYITADGIIREIHYFKPNDTNAVLAARDDIQFVLETKAGWFTRHHIATGTVIASEKGPLAKVFLQ